ncbi:MAG: YfcC family protein [Anaerolineales bacterium]|nr:YfcC family protein [Anaerolineales bacterium]
MTESKSGIRISVKAFIQAMAIIFFLMLVAGLLTRLIPAGQYARTEVDGRQVIDAESFALTERPEYPVWRWFTAPFEVFTAEGGMTIIGVILFIVLVGIAFAVMDRSGILHYVIYKIVQKFGAKKYILLVVLTFFFMALGGFFGILEEAVPLVPIIIALAYTLGWDSLTGLGISILATNVGFSTAVFNFFTIGTAHRLAGLPLFSGWQLRIVLFVLVFILLATFLVRYAKKVDRRPEASPVYEEDRKERGKFGSFHLDAETTADPRMKRAAIFLGIFFALILVAVMTLSWIPSLNDLAMPLSGLLFVIGGVGAALIAGVGQGAWKATWDGFVGIAPAIPLLMMAASVKHIIASGGILDTLLHWASTAFAGADPFTSSLIIYGLTLVLELFVTSGSAKALLVIPILMPLADLVEVNRQIAVSAYCFGDGFSNLVYPTNALLLITLSLTVVPYHKWLKWVLRLWPWVILATIAFLAVAVAINYGPF